MFRATVNLLLLAALFVVSGTIVFTVSSTARNIVALHVCSLKNVGDRQIDCVLNLVEKNLNEQGLDAAVGVFARAYSIVPALPVPCHRQAHRVGDLVYYQVLSGNISLDDLDFPQEASACNYGFFHGFFEHYFQDHPDPEEVARVCEEMQVRFGHRLGKIKMICYHGAGHGFLLAHTDQMSSDQWGDLKAFTEKPARQCLRIPGSGVLAEECVAGVVGTVFEYGDGEYDFHIDPKEPFLSCEALSGVLYQECIEGAAQKIDVLSEDDPGVMRDMVAAVRRPEPWYEGLSIGVAGIVRKHIDDPGIYKDVLDKCSLLDSDWFAPCMHGLVNGFFCNGKPQREYERALEACTHSSIKEHGLVEACHKSVAQKLPWFYTDEDITSICLRWFPKIHRHICTAQIST